MPPHIPYLGEMMALGSSMAWAIAVIFFKRSGETVHPIALNLFKDTLGVVLVVPSIYLLGQEITRPVPASDYLILIISGVMGIGIADTLFFMSLNLLGAGLSAIVDCLYSPFVIGAAMLILGERLRWLQLIGVAMIVSAVLEATLRKQGSHLTRRNLWLGILYGALAMGVMAVGIVLAKPVLERSPLLWASLVRMVGGILVLGLVLLLRRDRRAILQSMSVPHSWGHMFWGAFLGAYVSVLLWLGGMKYAHASVAAALNQTSNIFIFICAAVFLHERMTRQRIIGILLAVAGVYLVTFG